jgi:hypothetical protein
LFDQLYGRAEAIFSPYLAANFFGTPFHRRIVHGPRDGVCQPFGR